MSHGAFPENERPTSVGVGPYTLYVLSEEIDASDFWDSPVAVLKLLGMRVGGVFGSRVPVPSK